MSSDDRIIRVRRRRRLAKTPMTEDRPWQRRLKAAGLTQRQLANISGHLEKTVSHQIRGQRKGGVPKHLKAIIIAWELMNGDQRRRWISLAQAEAGDDDKKTKSKREGSQDLENENEALRTEVDELRRRLGDSRKR